MRSMPLSVVVLFVLLGASLWASTPPWPTPPPDDDDPLLCRPADYGRLLGALDRLIELESTAATLSGGGRIVDATGRTWSRREGEEGGLDVYAVDFLFWLGPAGDGTNNRFRVTRVVRTERIGSGEVSVSTEESPEILLSGEPFEEPARYLAVNMEALEACRVVLADPAVRTLAAGLIPYYSLQSVCTPVDAGYSSGRPLPVTVEFVNQTDRDDRYRLVAEVTGGDRGEPVLKRLRYP